MSIKRLLEQNVWNAETETWEEGYSKTAAQLVETSDGSNVQTVLNAIPGQITAAKDDAMSEIRGGVAAEGNTLAKVYAIVHALEELVKSDDIDLDTVQEIVDYIKVNRDDLTLMGTNKVGVSDIVNDLLTTITIEGKVLDARQGKVLKDTLDIVSTNVSTLQTQAADFVTTQQFTDGMASATAAAKTVISETPPSNPINGQIWLKPAGTITLE